MDTDDCNESEREAFISKSMFKDNWLYDYIVPIYNIQNIEEVLINAGVIEESKEKFDKGKDYLKIFPINKKPYSDDTLLEVKTLKEKIENGKKPENTNLPVFIEYCLSLLK